MTDTGRLIRTKVDQVRITGRHTMGVMLLRLGESEHVTSVFPVMEGEEPASGDPVEDSVGK
jgi:DNA gyrase subunit A